METAMQQVLFYCVKCNQLKTVEQANRLFRTGFYQARYPLGCCVHCVYLERATSSKS